MPVLPFTRPFVILVEASKDFWMVFLLYEERRKTENLCVVGDDGVDQRNGPHSMTKPCYIIHRVTFL